MATNTTKPAAKPVLTIDQFAEKIARYKAIEKEASESRAELEKQLVELHFPAINSGEAASGKVQGTKYVVKVNTVVKYSIDSYTALCESVGREVAESITKPVIEFSKSKYNALIDEADADADADLITKLKGLIGGVIQVTKNRPTVSVERK